MQRMKDNIGKFDQIFDLTKCYLSFVPLNMDSITNLLTFDLSDNIYSSLKIEFVFLFEWSNVKIIFVIVK